MKNTEEHKLSNGTILKVGEYYTSPMINAGGRTKENRVKVLELIVGGFIASVEWSNNRVLYDFESANDWDWKVYVTPKKKILERLKLFVQISYHDRANKKIEYALLMFLPEKKKKSDFVDYITIEEAKELGLDMNFLKM